MSEEAVIKVTLDTKVEAVRYHLAAYHREQVGHASIGSAAERCVEAIGRALGQELGSYETAPVMAMCERAAQLCHENAGGTWGPRPAPMPYLPDGAEERLDAIMAEASAEECKSPGKEGLFAAMHMSFPTLCYYGYSPGTAFAGLRLAILSRLRLGGLAQ